jgi:NAD(P)-dependent dehydrogenase (short-subunit alcohol dehydrogenase family)
MYATKVTSFSLYSKKTALITGSTDGIGVTTAKNLAASGFNVIIHGRNSLRIEKAVEDIRSFLKDESTHSESQIYQVEADISTVDGCYCLVRDVQSILANNNLDLDVLMNNAGVFEQDHIITKDELEMTFAVNVMAPFVITSNLLNNLLKEKSKQSRIVIASSMSQCHNIEDWDDLNFKRRQYSAHRAYSESKLFDAMLTAEFATRLQVEGIATNTITCNSLDPGTVNTKMLLAGWGPCGIKVESALGK